MLLLNCFSAVFSKHRLIFSLLKEGYTIHLSTDEWGTNSPDLVVVKA